MKHTIEEIISYLLIQASPVSDSFRAKCMESPEKMAILRRLEERKNLMSEYAKTLNEMKEKIKEIIR